MKQCCQCGKTKPITDFPRNRSKPDGYEYRCKTCNVLKNREWKQANPDKVRQLKRDNYKKNAERERERARQRRIRNPEPLQRHNRTYNRTHPNRMNAVNAVNRAVADGSMPPCSSYPCTKCGETAQEYHHHSYEPEFWLDVIPLCRSCHRLLHTAAKREDKSS